MADEALRLLKTVFGHDGFRTGQELLVHGLAEGRDVLGIMPTGAGKSVCYQVPALMREGVTIVISPLISLMQDQVAALRANGIPAAYLNTSLSPAQLDMAMERAANGAYRIIYVAPERLNTQGFLYLCSQIRLALVAVDEAHCISQWGQDFRPEYLRITEFLSRLPVRPPVGAFTATATERVQEDIVRCLGLRSPVISRTGFDRPNLYFEVLATKKKDAALLAFMAERRDQCGIIYCASRKKTEEVCELLRLNGYAAGRYHAGLEDAERRRMQEDFTYERIRVMAATNAFGMGIDKSNVNFVVHYNMPKSMEAYYQEAGRAGRDGTDADCLLLYSVQDVIIQRRMITAGDANPMLSPEEQRNVIRGNLKRLDQMQAYCESKSCLRRYIRGYFGEEAPENCCSCSVCTGNRFDAVDETAVTKKVTKKEKRAAAAAAFVGSDEKKAELYEALRACRMELSRAAHVPPYIVCSDKTLQSMCEVCPRTAEEMLFVNGMGMRKTEQYGNAFIRTIVETLKALEPATMPEKSAVSDEDLYKLLRECRLSLAKEEKVPSFMICTDRMLQSMCAQRPQTMAQMQNIQGMEKKRLERYGKAFLKILGANNTEKHTHDWTPTEDEKLYKAFMSGATENVLALQLGVPVQQIRERLKVVCSVPAQASFQPAAVSVYDVPDDDLPPYMPLEDEVLPSSGLKQIPHVWQPEEDKRIFQLSRRGVDNVSIAQGIGCTAAEVEDRLSHLRWFAEHLYERE